MSVKGLLYIIIGLLILFFCPVIFIGIGLVLVGGVMLFAMGCAALVGLVMLMVKAASDPVLARRCGLGALIAYVVIGVLRRIPGLGMHIAMRGGGQLLNISNVVMSVAGYFAACMLLIYVRRNFLYGKNGGNASGWSNAGFLLAVIGAVIDLAATCFAMYTGMYGYGSELWFLFTLVSCALPLIGFLVILLQKPVGRKPTHGDGWPEAAPEEMRGAQLFTLGLIISIILRIVQSLLSAGLHVAQLARVVGYAGYIPLVLAIVGLVMFLTAKPLKAGAETK